MAGNLIGLFPDWNKSATAARRINKGVWLIRGAHLFLPLAYISFFLIPWVAISERENSVHYTNPPPPRRATAGVEQEEEVE